MGKPQNAEQAIMAGLDSVIEYIDANQLSDNDMSVLHKYAAIIGKNEGEALVKTVQLNQSILVSRLIAGKVVPSELSIAALAAAVNTLSRMTAEKKHLVLFENTLVELASRFDTQSNARLDILIHKIVCRFATAGTLARMPRRMQNDFLVVKDFGDLSSPQRFDYFYSIQTSGIFDQSCVCLDDFMSVFKLWNSRREEIKKAFAFFDSDIVSIALDRNSTDRILDERMLECFDYHVRQAVNKDSPERRELLQLCEKYDLPELAKIMKDSLAPGGSAAGMKM